MTNADQIKKALDDVSDKVLEQSEKGIDIKDALTHTSLALIAITLGKILDVLEDINREYEP